MKRTFRDFQEKLLEDLKNPELAHAYLNEALKDEDQRIFLLALKNVFEAQGETMTDIAKKSHLSRENIYRILSNKGNPKITSIISLLHAVGFSLAVQPNDKRSNRR
ncbi:putative addiction module antidote protein [candidate division TM6 bacterium RIFCSPHIGHO2_12_FULL_38_8]|nr:MAG: putative addiction module antidote protein [candidate division TM6 bacterium RIFCSPHIGHO2_12_FULL_38_8]